MVKKVVEFFRDSRNQHLATWVQTMAVVFGVVIALFQLSSILEESDYKKGEAFLKFESEFASSISREMGLIYEYHVNREKLTDASYNELYPRDSFIEARNSVQEFITRLSACGDHNVCPDDSVNKTVCSISRSMYTDLSRGVSWPENWKIEFSEPMFYESKINAHCGLWERFKFWYLR
ncbi:MULTISPECIES: hypothetical protein [unclassified Halomonas]|uniref:hypothetical protein n=1 Tax=unclassified Halomonas TaxID=2609666 RepID=UPI0020769663|nr:MULTISPECIES: hypothetical protein [unclassified Halomonas]